MKAVYIISEFNPFHNGHEYIIKKSKELTGADFCICLMSGDYVQRGAPAILDKYARARMALKGGADMIITLPTAISLSPADDFASGAISMIKSLGVEGYLAFGAECDDIGKLKRALDIMTRKPGDYENVLRASLKQGLSYPAASQRAYESVCGADIKDIPSSPNNILALSYLKALNEDKDITPVCIRRKGQAHNDRDTCKYGDACEYGDDASYLSSTSLRGLLLCERSDTDAVLRNALPDESYEILSHYVNQSSGQSPDAFISEDDFSIILRQSITRLSYYLGENAFIPYTENNAQLARRIYNLREDAVSFTGFRDAIKNKSVTSSAISRTLMRIALNIDDSVIKAAKDSNLMYARIVGVRKTSQAMIPNIVRSSDIPVIVNLSKDAYSLTSDRRILFDSDMLCEDIYRSVVSVKCKKTLPNQYEQRLVVV